MVLIGYHYLGPKLYAVHVIFQSSFHVSYVFHSPVGVGGWQHFDLKSELRFRTFVYDTAILWTDGIGSSPEAELQGELAETWKN